MKLALVHEWLDSWGGAEQTLLALHELYPEAPIFTTVCDPERVRPLKRAEIRTSFIQHIPGWQRVRPLLFPLMPLAVEQYDLREFDIIVSSSYGPAKGVLTGPGQTHICYCHTPTRFLWEPTIDDRLPKIWPAQQMATGLRIWDRQAAQRPDLMLANSKTVQRRITKYYGRQSEVIYPPVQTERFQPVKKVGDFYLSATRLVKQKRIELIIEAFRQNGLPLKIAGRGPDEGRLQALAAGAKNIEFVGFVSHRELEKLYAECLAFLFMAEEDFGIVPVEAMASGRPVIAYGQGGATETVVAGKTGLLVAEQTAGSLAETVERFAPEQFNSAVIQKHAKQFDVSVFQKQIRVKVEQAYTALER